MSDVQEIVDCLVPDELEVDEEHVTQENSGYKQARVGMWAKWSVENFYLQIWKKGSIGFTGGVRPVTTDEEGEEEVTYPFCDFSAIAPFANPKVPGHKAPNTGWLLGSFFEAMGVVSANGEEDQQKRSRVVRKAAADLARDLYKIALTREPEDKGNRGLLYDLTEEMKGYTFFAPTEENSWTDKDGNKKSRTQIDVTKACVEPDPSVDVETESFV
jgi:hypothetical protein